MTLSLNKQKELWEKVLGHPHRKRFGNPFYKDKNKDCCFRRSGEQVVLHDFGDPDFCGMTVSEAYLRKFGVHYTEENESDSVLKITLEAKFPITPSIIPWNKRGFLYWKQYGINPLDYPWIQQIDGYFLSEFHYVDLGFVYLYDHSLPKLYMPYLKPKFMGNVPGSYTKVLGEGEKTIACKAVKDQLVIDSLARVKTYHVQGEGNFAIPPLSPDYIFFDPDDAGIKGAKKYRELYGGSVTYVEEAKDISDYYFYYGKKKTQEKLKQIFNLSPSERKF